MKTHCPGLCLITCIVLGCCNTSSCHFRRNSSLTSETKTQFITYVCFPPTNSYDINCIPNASLCVSPWGGDSEPVSPVTKTIKELMKTCLQLSDPHVMERVTLLLHALE